MTTHDRLRQKLDALLPVYVNLENESHRHAGYFEGKQSHFKLTIVSAEFTDKRLIARHQQVYQLVDELMTTKGGCIHALGIHAYSPSEWQAMQEQSNVPPPSPQCASQKKDAQ